MDRSNDDPGQGYRSSGIYDRSILDYSTDRVLGQGLQRSMRAAARKFDQERQGARARPGAQPPPPRARAAPSAAREGAAGKAKMMHAIAQKLDATAG